MAISKKIWAGAVLLVLLVAVIFYIGLQKAQVPRSGAVPAVSVQQGQAMLPTTTITIGNTTVTAELATTPTQQEDGLSNRTALADGTGMLFVFPQPADLGFWMKDMRFPLDIIFIDADKTIITIAPNLSPDTYPQAFHPSSLAKYVLEVPAGFAAAHAVAIGQKIVLQ